MKILNISKHTVVAADAARADSFFARLKGLLGRRRIHRGEGLILKPCAAIHMFFMRFAIDVLFLDSSNKVIYVLENIRPWRISPYIAGASCAVELAAGSIRESRTEITDMLSFT